jgi:predicted DCC family thiol-disulfide oxidoreductase YuxK
LETATSSETLIVLFDGVCNLCNGAVGFIIRNDPHRRFRFAALQSPVGQTLLQQRGLPAETLDSIVFIEGECAFTKSTAALRIARRLGSVWPAAFLFILVPRPLRDLCYTLIARNRYRIFGKRDACMMPTPELKTRFLTGL